MEKAMDKSVRLSNNIRDGILKAILSSAFDKKKEALEERRLALSEEVYNDIYPAKVREKMYALEAGWLPESNQFQVQFGGHSSGVCERNLKEPKRFLAKHRERSYGQILKVYDNSHRFTKKHDDLTADITDYKESYNRSNNEARAILYSCNTTKQLKEAWPEIAKFVEIYESPSERTTAIVPITTELNKALGLAS